MNQGPTRGAEEVNTGRWSAHPWLGRGMRWLTVVLPIVAAAVVAKVVGPSLWRGTGGLGSVLWLAQIAAVSTATVLVADRFARRLLPLAGLFNLSLVFPDEAPSRFSVALRSGTTRRLQERLAQRDAGEIEALSAEQLLAMVATLNDHDRLTRGHTERVRAYSELIAEGMDLDPEARWKLRWAVLLHDIGKLTVPPEILNKDGRPTDEEWEVLRGHPAAGAEMVEPLAEWLGEWRHAAGQHHERWDGKGYPHGLAGEQISLAGRIVAVADAFDVITSARSYKKPTDPAVARQELVRCSGSQFDPDVVRALLNVSLGKLRLVGGPLAWLAAIPGMGNVGGAVAAGATNAVVAASVVAGAVVGGAGLAPPRPVSEVVTAGAVAPNRTMAHRGGPLAGNAASGASAGGEGVPGESGDADAPSGRRDAGEEGRAGGDDAGATNSDDASRHVTSTTMRDGQPPDEPVEESPSTTVRRDATTTTRSPQSTPPTSTAPVGTVAPTTSRPATPTTTAVVGPTARADSFNIGTGVSGDFAVLANDSPGTFPLVAAGTTIVSPPSHATSYSVLASGAIRYRSTLLFIGTDTLQYRVCDTSARCATATLSIRVGLL